ncbi:MAG: hypothetical protein ACI853_002094 [Paracoccaceae bacterium]|jgi:hypothetical protein
MRDLIERLLGVLAPTPAPRPIPIPVRTPKGPPR